LTGSEKFMSLGIVVAYPQYIVTLAVLRPLLSRHEPLAYEILLCIHP